MNNKKLIAFDMDGTLSASRSKTDKEMWILLERLSQKYIVVIISWGSFDSIIDQVVSEIPFSSNMENIFIYSNTGTKKYIFQGGKYILEYKNDFSEEEIEKINKAFDIAILDLNLIPEKLYGPLTENRWAQVTFAGQWQMAPIEVKEKWDPDQVKRKKIREYILPMLSDFNVNIAGTTSVDITRKWVDKWSAMLKITDEFELKKDDILFVWDSIFPGGNDYPAKEAGFETIQVSDYHETKKIIADLLK